MRTVVMSLGGSIIAPKNEGINHTYIRQFVTLLTKEIQAGRRFVVVTGGGSLARSYQSAYRQMVETPDTKALDAIGIRATHIHAEYIASICAAYGDTCVLIPPIGSNISTFPISHAFDFLIAGGCKIGVSTDYIATKLAERLHCTHMLNISNVPYIYDADPAHHSDAQPLERLAWNEYKEIIAGMWKPGAHVPFDPFAADVAAKSKISVQFIGSDLEGLITYLRKGSAIGTYIS